tara:strand:- start:4093 stop:4446 length:354 start_codon:yes stop_codon:yes gene_type:complete
MITRAGRLDIKEYLQANFNRFKVGTGGDSTNPNASNLDAPIGGLNTITTNGGSVRSVGRTTLEFNVIISGSAYLGQTIKEVGIFNSSDEMLIRVNYDGFGPLSATDEVNFIITIEVD